MHHFWSWSALFVIKSCKSRSKNLNKRARSPGVPVAQWLDSDFFFSFPFTHCQETGISSFSRAHYTITIINKSCFSLLRRGFEKVRNEEKVKKTKKLDGLVGTTTRRRKTKPAFFLSSPFLAFISRPSCSLCNVRPAGETGSAILASAEERGGG